MIPPPEARSDRPRRRLLFGIAQLLLAVLAIYLALSWLGFRLIRSTRSPLPLSGSELEHSAAAAPPTLPVGDSRPTNVIVFVADGLGFAHLTAARVVHRGMGGDTAWDRFTTSGWHRTHSARGFIVDSAASATALATGVPTRYGWFGVDVDGNPLPNLFERAAELGYRTGVVTDSYVWDATPAAFTVHGKDRDAAGEILAQLAESSLELLIGELEDLGEDEVPELEPTIEILQRRFKVIRPGTADAISELRAAAGDAPLAALFEEDQIADLQSTPALPQLIEVALERLGVDERPFLLLVESEESDSASHDADFDRLLRGMEAIEASLDLLLDFAGRRGDTLLLFTSDHETGGLAVSLADETNTSLRAFWSTSDHSAIPVPLFAIGPGASRFAGAHATWEVGRLLATSVLAGDVAGEEAASTPAAVGDSK